jgi:hypothetical protein
LYPDVIRAQAGRLCSLFWSSMTNGSGQNNLQSEHTDFAALARHLDLSLEKPLGRRAWLGRTEAGNPVVIKSGPGASPALHDFLIKFKSLYPPFDYPQVIAAEPGFYLVYAFISGDLLSEGEFESQEALRAAFELSGRITALFRSLKLAPLFQGMQSKAQESQDPQGDVGRRLAALGSGLDYQVDGLAIRRWEASQSYAWAQGIMPYCSSRWPGNDLRPAALWSALQDRVETVTSIHLAPQGSNLAHTCFTPEHLLAIPGDRRGIVGWQVAPRPYNYMRYRYLAWCLVHTQQGNIENRYRQFLESMPSIHYSTANFLTFILSLLETWVETQKAIRLRAEKLQTLWSFIDEAVATAR